MTSDKSYRLGNYRITLYDGVLVRWEQHAPLGVARSGRCFLSGNVLIIGKKSRDEEGFLIGEFVDRLRKLPSWTGTRYYCLAGELLDTATGQGLADEALERFSSFADRDRVAPTYAEVASPGAFRLGHYQITVAADRAISWQAYGELNRIVSGHCSIESDILIIGHEEHDKQGQGRQEFLDALGRLPQWDKTMAWCRGSVLRLCQDMQQEEKLGIIGRFRDRVKDLPAGEKLHQTSKEIRETKPGPSFSPAYVGRYEETGKKFLLSGKSVIKKAWQHVPRGKARLKWLALLVAAMVLVGLTAILYIAEDGLPWSHGFKKHHHRHHDHDR